ncbi:MAG: UDP-N-acetylglucosamine--N-acetylmuramyl-(pentapeptide) pyrophosphoryl-undecaprenol N-acetylglucosamine transferase [Planctomycetes bacterium]|nr:UDP-N-acetylglucosamine--N-acetylmuramyl-(pentapeptide) pyrophosphoryl-undecaprenol N-acetylglucosamine transferase [Planctomycetota bacterium]
MDEIKRQEELKSPRPGCYFFAGGGTGGHIYPAIAIARKIKRLEPEAAILFFCSARAIDSQILAPSGFEYVALPGRGFSARPDKAAAFAFSLAKGYSIAKKKMRSVMHDAGCKETRRAVVIGVGGFASATAVLAGRRAGAAVAMVNVDIVPGKANRLLAAFAQKIFVQFADTAECFGKAKDRVVIAGCPLRASFESADGANAIAQLGLDAGKKTLVVTGASSGSLNINRAIATVLRQLDAFADAWQVVHLTGGAADLRDRQARCASAKIAYHIVDYYDDMASLLAAADLVVGRSGAVSVAEYAASQTPAICLPYPYHKDRHQYLNAAKLVDAGAALIVDDIPADPDATANALAEQLKTLMADDNKRNQMAAAAATAANPTAAKKIAGQIVALCD